MDSITPVPATGSTGYFRFPLSRLVNPGFLIPDLGLAFPDLGLELPDLGLAFPDLGLELPDLGLELPDLGLELPDLGLEVPDLGLEVPDPAAYTHRGEVLIRPVERICESTAARAVS
jgi:hypothetical protein